MNHHLLKKLFPALLLALTAMAALSMTACGSRGEAEKAGEKVDEAVDGAADQAEDMSEGDGPAEEAGEKVDDAVDGD